MKTFVSALSLLASANFALGDFKLRVITADGPFAGEFLQVSEIGAAQNFLVPVTSDDVATFDIRDGNLTQTNLPSNIPANSFNGFFPGNNDTQPLIIGAGGFNASFSQGMNLENPQLLFNGGNQWYLCNTVDSFGQEVENALNYFFGDVSDLPTDCQGVIIETVDVASTTTSSTMSSTTTSMAITGTATSINSLIAIKVQGNGISDFVTYAHVGAAQNFAVAGSTVYPFTLENGNVTLQGLPYPGLLGFKNTTDVNPLFIGSISNLNITFSVDIDSKLLVNGMNNWFVCDGSAYMGYSYDSVINFGFDGASNATCTSVELIVEPLLTPPPSCPTCTPPVVTVTGCITCTGAVNTNTIVPPPLTVVQTQTRTAANGGAATQTAVIQYNPNSAASKMSSTFTIVGLTVLAALFV